MDTSNWRGPQGGNGAIGDSSMESGDWRAQLQADSRQRIVNKIMDTLKRHLPFSGHEGLQELKKIAVRFEEKIYTAATSQSDYLRKISLKMLTMETRSQNSMPEAMQANSGANSVNPSDPGSQVMQQVNSQGQPLPIPVPSNQNQQFLSQTMHNNMGSSGIQGSSSLSSALPPGAGLPQSSNVSSQNPTLQGIQNMSGSQQGNTMGPTNFANQRQIPGRQQPQQPQQQQQQPQQQQQQQNQNSHYAYQQQLQQMAKQKLQGNNITPSMQQIQQQQQQNLLQQPSVMQPTMMQSVQNQPQSSQPMMNHQQQSALRQQRQQVQVQPTQQQVQPPQQQQQQQQPNATNMQQNQLMGAQQNNTYSNMQQNQLMGQQNKPQQHLIGQHNNLSGMQQQHMGGGGGGGGGQSSVSGGQQQQLLGTQSGNSGMQHMMQSKIPVQQQSSGALLPTQPQQQSQPQVMPHMQTQSGQVAMQQQQQQQPNMMQQRLPNAAGFQQQNVIDQQKQLFQQQRPMQEASSTSLDSTAQTGNPNGGAWQEEVYQKIKAMKDLYLLDLNDMHQKILGKLQQHDSLPQQPKNEQLEKLKVFKNMLERFMAFLQIPKHNILANYKDKLSTYEKQIVHVITSNRRKPGPTQQQQQQQQQQPQQLPPPHMQSQSQQTHSQLTHEIPMTSQMQTVSSLSGGSNSQQQTMMNSMQPSSNLDSVSGGGPQSQSQAQQVNINPMVSHGAMGTLQPNPNPNLLHIKQQEQLLQSQQLKQFQNRQMQQQFLHKQQLMQQQQQFRQQQQGNQVNQVNQLSQLHDAGDIKLRQQQQQQQMGVKPATFQQQRTGGYHQQMKPGGSPFSPQLIPGGGGSPQISQHASPQIDQQNMFKPMQSANSPFTVPSPSTPSASPLPGDFERITALTNPGNISHGTGQHGQLTSQSLAIGTPGISASPLLAEFTSPDGTTTTGVVASISGKSNGAEQPLERLLKAVKSISATALAASVGDIGSVVSMIDRIAGSAPGNGSRAAVGEDLVAMTKCRLQARTFVNQDGTNGVRKMKRFTSAMPLNVVSSAGSVNDSFKQLTCVETSELDSTASSKRPRVESNHALLEELKEINRGLIDTVVDISEEDVDPAAASSASEGADGTVVKCSFSAVALGPNLKSQYASAQMSPIQPLRLLVPANYPNCSPILLDKFPVEVSKEYEDLSVKAKSRFSISLRSLSQPMSLKEIAKTWDVCARAVISEYAQLSGGGTFSSKYGTWDNCLTAV